MTRRNLRRGVVIFTVWFLGVQGAVWADGPSLEERIRVLEVRLAKSEELQEKVANLERENDLLRSKVAALESVASKAPAGVGAPAVPEKPKPEPVLLDRIGAKLKVKGRWSGGFFKSGRRGSFHEGSFEVPEAKVLLSFEPDSINTAVMRMNFNNAAFNSVDYLYLDSKDFLPQLRDTPFTLESRIGRFKLQYGEETLSNNIVEGALVSNSAANATGTDEGAQLSGAIGKENPLKWYFSVTNGNSGTGSDNLTPKAYAGKLAYSPLAPLSLSGSVYHSGSLKTAASEFSFAGVTSRPAGADRWDRTLWEVDARWDFQKGKVIDPPAYTDSKAYIRAAFGQLYDDVGDVTAVSDREANYGYVETLCNFHPKWYGAFRYSLIDMRHGGSMTLNNAAGDSTRYDRYSIALGHRWSDKTIIKIGYDINVSDVVSGSDPADDLISAVVVSSF